MGELVFKRIVLKVSGEVLGGEPGCGIDERSLEKITAQISDVMGMGVEVGAVVGGGNFFRGASTDLPGLDRIASDYMGMLATVMNAVALKSCLAASERESRILSAIPVQGVTEPFVREKAVSHLESGRAVIFAGGTGHPYFTTDTAAVLRAVQIGAAAVLKGTKVDGVYSADPLTDPDATRYDRLTFMDIIQKRLHVVDTTAASLCMDNDLPLIVFNVQKHDALKRIIMGEPLGTLVKGEHHD